MPELQITGLTKTFGDTVALDDVTITAHDGEMLTLLGPSGCGKSTTLWSIAGLHTPDAGSIRVGEHTLFDAATKTSLPPERRQCGVVFQSYAIWPHLSVADNVAYPLKLRRVPKARRRDRVAEVLELVELGPYAQRYPHELSGGQQQRVALARALAHPPEVLLLDEPFSNLDAKLRERARTWLRDLQRSLALTTVFVTHDQDEALSMSDRIVVMSAGRIQQVGTPEQIYGRPTNPFVADFIGNINLLTGHVVNSTGTYHEVELDGIDTVLRVQSDGEAQGDVTIAVRPEAVIIHDKTSDTAITNRFDATVSSSAFLGDHLRYQLQLGTQTITVQTDRTLGAGRVDLELPPDRLQLFPGVTTIEQVEEEIVGA
ncbi:ABC transporter ATP-binding protein [soil metagenome]